MSVPEVMRLRPQGLKFRRQHPAGSYVLDFFCSDAKLAIELDGISHDMGVRPMLDAGRDAWLRLQEIAVVRFPAADVVRHVDVVVNQIVAACGARIAPPPSLRDGPPPRSWEETI